MKLSLRLRTGIPRLDRDDGRFGSLRETGATQIQLSCRGKSRHLSLLWLEIPRLRSE
jgi:hypothetical protein